MAKVETEFTDEVVTYSLKKIEENYNTNDLSKVQFSEILNKYQDLYNGIAIFEIKEKGKPMYWLTERELKVYSLTKLKRNANTKMIIDLFYKQGIIIKPLEK